MLAGITFLQGILAFLLVVICVMLMGIILLQKGRGGGLSAAFGGGGGSSAFGSKTGDVLTWFTVALAGGFLLLAVVSNYAFDMSVDESTPQISAPDGSASPPPTDIDLSPEGAKAPTTQPATQSLPPVTPAAEVPPPGATDDGADSAETGDTGSADAPVDDTTMDEGSEPASPEQP